MRPFFSVFSALLFTPPRLLGPDTPQFYLVASSKDGDVDLRPLRTEGGAHGYSTLSGSGSIGRFYFSQGDLVGAPRVSGDPILQPNIAAIPLIPVGCSDYGPLGFATHGSTDKCAKFWTFNIRSNQQDSQLGAELIFNHVGSFYACGQNQDVWYKISPEEGPLDCSPINLYTVPVAI